MSKAPAAKSPSHAPQLPQGQSPMMGQRAAEKASAFGPSLKRLLGRLLPERATIAMILFLALGGTVFSVVGPKMLGRATDVIFTGVIGEHLPVGTSKVQVVAWLRASGRETFADMVAKMDIVPGRGIDFAHLAGILALALGLYVVSGLFLWLQGYLLNGVVQRTIYDLRSAVESKIHRLPLSYFDKMARGELLSRVTNDIDNVSQSLQQTLGQVLTSLLMVMGIVAMMILVAPVLVLVALVTIPVSMIITARIAQRSQQHFAAQWKSTGELNAQIEEAFTGHTLVKVFGRNREMTAQFASKNEELFVASFGAQAISGLIMPAMMFVRNLSYVVIAVVGGLRVASGAMRLGDVQAFIQYSRMFTQPLSQLASMANLLQSGVASFERVVEVLDASEQKAEAPGGFHFPKGRIAFEHVSFAYDSAKPLIEDLNLVAQPGHTVAIVGPTGAGKTTLVNLIMRFYELDRGRITLDGVDVATIPRRDLRANIGMVLQDAWLFHGTIRENIAYGCPSATEAQIHAAAEAAYVDRFVHSLPQGYDTVIDEEGGNISAGEKQLLTIARAFLADRAILILDEATSSVDTRTEVLVRQAMAALRCDRTSFVIAHRLSTIRDADMILVMENGAIVEQGDHAELLSRQGQYFALYDSQFAQVGD